MDTVTKFTTSFWFKRTALAWQSYSIWFVFLSWAEFLWSVSWFSFPIYWNLVLGRFNFDSTLASSRMKYNHKIFFKVTAIISNLAISYLISLVIYNLTLKKYFCKEVQKKFMEILREFDPGSGWTLAVCFTHASRTRVFNSSGGRVSNT